MCVRVHARVCVVHVRVCVCKHDHLCAVTHNLSKQALACRSYVCHDSLTKVYSDSILRVA